MVGTYTPPKKRVMKIVWRFSAVAVAALKQMKMNMGITRSTPESELTKLASVTASVEGKSSLVIYRQGAKTVKCSCLHLGNPRAPTPTEPPSPPKHSPSADA